MKMIKVKTTDAPNYLARQKWLDSIYKASNQLEKILSSMPDGLTKGEKGQGQNETAILIRRAERLEYQIRNATEVENDFGRMK